MNCWKLFTGVILFSLVCHCSPVPNASGNVTELVGGFIVVAGGIDYYTNPSQSVFLLNTLTRAWSSMPALPTATEGSQLFYADGKLLSAGGNLSPTSFLLYNRTSLTWKALTDMNRNVDLGPCGAILDGSLYLIGGFGQGSGTLVMNPFSFPTWVPGAQMQQARTACGATTLGNYVYACGDWSNTDGNTCEKFDPTTNSWSFIASMNDYRMGKILVALNGYLYAVGGNNLGTAERYDPETNAWTYIQPLNDHSRTFSAAVSDGILIYLVGGCNGMDRCDPGTEINTVEVYIPELDEWDVLPPLPEAREDAAIAYLRQMPI